MKRLIVIILTGMIFGFSSGCSTVMVRNYPSCKSEGMVSVYPATFWDGFCIITGGGDLEGHIKPEGYLILSPFWLIDLPFSLVTDTIFLPTDIYWRAKRNKEKK